MDAANLHNSMNKKNKLIVDSIKGKKSYNLWTMEQISEIFNKMQVCFCGKVR
jgi:hypothetical protein